MLLFVIRDSFGFDFPSVIQYQPLFDFRFFFFGGGGGGAKGVARGCQRWLSSGKWENSSVYVTFQYLTLTLTLINTLYARTRIRPTSIPMLPVTYLSGPEWRIRSPYSNIGGNFIDLARPLPKYDKNRISEGDTDGFRPVFGQIRKARSRLSRLPVSRKTGIFKGLAAYPRLTHCCSSSIVETFVVSSGRLSSATFSASDRDFTSFSSAAFIL